MIPPENIETFETPLATLWFDTDGILYSFSKPVPHTLENTKQTYDFVKSLLQGKKACIISEITKIQPMDKATRDYIAMEVPGFIKASAIIVKSALGRMIASLFIQLKGTPVPTKFFRDEGDAKKWLKKFLIPDSSEHETTIIPGE